MRCEKGFALVNQEKKLKEKEKCTTKATCLKGCGVLYLCAASLTSSTNIGFQFKYKLNF